uniref:Uncharacterized protein n=1 Tax=Lactuca sativa TaxID=4236 RepID=A0A9R1X9S0_LACSA|nr:hypothetical protein LSAT_V11C500278910 [Lactuca sativa]
MFKLFLFYHLLYYLVLKKGNFVVFDSFNISLVYLKFKCYFVSHDFSFINMKAFANLKGSGGNIWEVFVVLDDARRVIFRDTRRQTLKYSVSGFTAPIRIWIYEMIPAVRACGFSGTKKLKWVDVNKIWSKIQEGQPPRQNMLPGDGEMTYCYYMSFQEYVYGEGKAVPSPVRDHFRRQDESSSSMSSSGCSHGRGRGSGKHNLDEVLKRLHALEQHVFMNRQPTKVVQDEVTNKNNTTENVFGDIQDDKVLEERNDYAGNKFDDDVFDVNDYSEVKEESKERNDNAGKKFDDDVSDEDEIIITGIVDYFDEYDGKELHTTPKQKRRTKKNVDIKSTSPVPPPVFGVAHDFSMLRLQPYVAGGEVVIQNYIFHSYDVQHHLFNFVLDRDFWSSLFGHTHDGWLESASITKLSCVQLICFIPFGGCARIIEDYGGGHYAIPNDDPVVGPNAPGRRVRPRRERDVEDEPPVIPVENEDVPMDWYNVEMRRMQDQLARGLNFSNQSHIRLFDHFNIPHIDGGNYPFIPSWDERIAARRSGAGGSGAANDDEEDED